MIKACGIEAVWATHWVEREHETLFRIESNRAFMIATVCLDRKWNFIAIEQFR